MCHTCFGVYHTCFGVLWMYHTYHQFLPAKYWWGWRCVLGCRVVNNKASRESADNWTICYVCVCRFAGISAINTFTSVLSQKGFLSWNWILCEYEYGPTYFILGPTQSLLAKNWDQTRLILSLACCLLAEAGKDGWYIKLRLRWVSDCYEVYIKTHGK